MSNFSQNIAPYVKKEMINAYRAQKGMIRQRNFGI